jgi:ADP-ribosyl-[dinitrogen reductase] hydrolase
MNSEAFADRIRGMLYGIAIGDSLGNTTEGQTPSGRCARYGEIRGYLPNRHLGGHAGGTPSDDTQTTCGRISRSWRLSG